MSASEIQVHISEKPYQDGDNGPQVIFGFTHPAFSQAVFLDAPTDPQMAVKVADQMYKSFIDACGAAVKEWKEKHPDSE